MTTKILSRLYFLANELRHPFPSSLAQLIPQGDLILKIAQIGEAGTITSLRLDAETFEGLIEAGKNGGKASFEEWKYLTVDLALAGLRDREDTLSGEEHKIFLSRIMKWAESESGLVDYESSNWEFDPEEKTVVKWPSGFEPFDVILDNFYQGIFTIMGKPGTGKTTHMIKMAHTMKATGIASEVWFYQTELSMPLFKFRSAPVRKTGVFTPKDRIICGMVQPAEMIEACLADPNPDRVIFFDSPDILAVGEQKRFILENIYRDLVRLKTHCKAIIVASQPRRKDSKNLSLESPAESAAKSWYTDALIGFQRLGTVNGTRSALLKATVLKNRFGVPDQTIQYEFDQVSFETQLKGKLTNGQWEDEGEADW